MTGSNPTAGGRIFISYRRQDSAYPAGWLYDRVAAHFGRDQVFKDVDSIELGDDFAEVISAAVGSCDVLIALIGDQWLASADEAGGRRLDNSDDFVRLEIEAALARKVRVIPILVEGARMPRADELPASLAKLVRHQALELNPSRFDFDTNRLLKVLDKTLRERHTLRESGEQARGKTEEEIPEATASIRDAPPIEAAESEPSSAEATPGPMPAEGSSVTGTRAAGHSDQPQHLEAPQGAKSVESSASGGGRIHAPDLVAMLAQRARESGMSVRTGETHGAWSFPLVAVDERPLAIGRVLTLAMSPLKDQPKIRLVYVVAELPASQDILDRFVDEAWAYASRGRLIERQSVSLVCMPIAILPRDELVLPKTRLHVSGAKVPVMIDIKTREVSYNMPRRVQFARQARELTHSFLAGINEAEY
jgi:hypothetical protein